MILVYSALIHACKYKQLNYEFGSNNSTAVHILGHEGKNSVFSEEGKTRLKKEKKDENKGKVKKTKQKKNIKNKVHFLPFLKNSHTCNYHMHEKPKICPGCTIFT